MKVIKDNLPKYYVIICMPAKVFANQYDLYEKRQYLVSVLLNSFFMFYRKKNVIQVWIDMRVSK